MRRVARETRRGAATSDSAARNPLNSVTTALRGIAGFLESSLPCTRNRLCADARISSSHRQYYTMEQL
eukprot:848439-Pleurochrysis_carterae.AAC.1